jgi:hypothetical protein
MEILIFALIASYNMDRLQERVVSEPEEFQPFDLRALRRTPNAEPARTMAHRSRERRSLHSNEQCLGKFFEAVGVKSVTL